MKSSSLAERLEEFEAIADALDSRGSKPLPALSVVPEVPRQAPKRLTLGTRRIQIRDEGLRPFRVS
jgi:hypothetical protein